MQQRQQQYRCCGWLAVQSTLLEAEVLAETRSALCTTDSVRSRGRCSGTCTRAQTPSGPGCLVGSMPSTPAVVQRPEPQSRASGSGFGRLDRRDRDRAVIGNGDYDVEVVRVVDDRQELDHRITQSDGRQNLGPFMGIRGFRQIVYR